MGWPLFDIVTFLIPVMFNEGSEVPTVVTSVDGSEVATVFVIVVLVVMEIRINKNDRNFTIILFCLLIIGNKYIGEIQTV